MTRNITTDTLESLYESHSYDLDVVGGEERMML